jgi:hypothetical protein
MFAAAPIGSRSKQIKKMDIMKKLMLLIAVIALGLLGLSTSNLQAASGNTNVLLPISFQITGLIPHTTIVTNGDVVTSTETPTRVKIGNQNILDLLQAEFGTTFPVGAQLAIDLTGQGDFHVLDRNGNSILNASTNASDSSYGFGLSNTVAGAYVPAIGTGKRVDNTVTSNATIKITTIAPDYGIYFFDSHGNNFHLDGLITLKANASVKSTNITYNSISFTIVGSGGGVFFNPIDGLLSTGVFTKVKVSAKGTGIIE